jgi:hypothetical protein
MSNITMDDIKPYIPAILAALLFIWSEYLGVTTKHKSNAIIQLIMCALTHKEDEGIELTPPAVIVSPPAANPPSSK